MAASLKLSELTSLERHSSDQLAGKSIDSDDYLLIADVSETASKKATFNEVSVCLKDTDYNRSLAVEATECLCHAFGETNLFVQTLLVGG